MTVLAVTAILVTLAAPSFREMLERRRLEGRANEFATDLQYAKSEALARNRNVMLRTSPTGTTCYTIAVWTTGTGNCDCTATPACTGGPLELKTVTLTNGIAVDTNTRFDFEPVRGALVPATAVSASLQLNSRSYAVSVTALGRVTSFTP